MTNRDRGTAAGLAEAADLATPMAIRVAATLRVADHIAGGLGRAEEIARAAGADADALDRLLRHLAHARVLEVEEDGRYTLTPLGESLRDDHPSGLRARLDVDGALGRAELSLVHLLDSVRTGDAAFPRLHGASFWDDLAADPERSAGYDRQMGADVAAWAPHVVAGYRWSDLARIVDVGGGDGTLLAAILREHPSLRGTVFDQPRTAPAARATLAEAGLEDRGDVASGSFFESVPPGADGYVLCAILHDWADDPARAILQRCAQAAGRDARILVIEKTGPGCESPSTGMDLRMLAWFGARERGAAAISALAADVGLDTRAVHPAGALSIVELVPD